MKTPICIVDDELDLLDVCKDFLSRDFDVRTFCSGAEAIKELELNYKPELVITDLRMPEMSGFDFIDNLKKKHINVGVVIISGFGEKSDVLKAMESEVMAFVEKPFDLSSLVSSVHKAVHGFQRARQTELLVAKSATLAKLTRELAQNTNAVGQEQLVQKVLQLSEETEALISKLA